MNFEPITASRPRAHHSRPQPTLQKKLARWQNEMRQNVSRLLEPMRPTQPSEHTKAFISAPAPASQRHEATRKASWQRLPEEIKLHIAQLCDDNRDVYALGSAEVSLIPVIAKMPWSPPRQERYDKAILHQSGEALLSGLKNYAEEYRASRDFVLPLDSEESVEVIEKVFAFRAGRGPTPQLGLSQDKSAQIAHTLPQDLHLDIDVTQNLLRRNQQIYYLPQQTQCLTAWLLKPLSDRSTPEDRQLRVRGRHKYAASKNLMRIGVSYGDFSRGRLDLSAVDQVNFIELWCCNIGKGDFGLRWPKQVHSLRLVGCQFSDQAEAFELPQGLKILDINETDLASLAPNWLLPPTLEDLSIMRCSIAGKTLPSHLPPALVTLSCCSKSFPFDLRQQEFPQCIQDISLSDDSHSQNNFRRFKIYKRNWANALKQKHPSASVSIL